jgi:thiamine-phosphate pyrophosphorylase
VGQDDLPVEAVRSALQAAGRDPGGFIIGLSTHDEREVREAVSMGVSYIGFGPIYGTATKSDALSARGTDALRRAVQVARGVPVVAIGGLTLDRADDVASTGASMAAVIADIHRAPEPIARASAWHRRFGGA